MDDSARNQSAFKVKSGQGPKLTDEEATLQPGASAAFDDGSVSYSHEGKGTYWHCSFYMIAILAGPALLGFPYSMVGLTWGGGIAAYLVFTFIFIYCNILVASVHQRINQRDGKRYHRYRDLTGAVFGRWRGWIAIVPWQYSNVIGASIAFMIVGGESIQAVYTSFKPDGDLTLPEFIVMIGAVWLLASFIPRWHSLRYIAALAVVCTFIFSIIAIGLAIHEGQNNGPQDYGLHGSTAGKTFQSMAALGVVAYSFGNCIIPELQATVKEPADKEMFKAFAVEYGIVAPIYFLVTWCGYWAFGSDTEAYLLDNFTGPKWALTVANVAAFVQIVPSIQVYNQVVYEIGDKRLCRPKEPIWSLWNTFARAAFRVPYICLVVFLACL